MQKCDNIAKRPAKLVALLTAKMFRCLMDGPTTVNELCHLTGLGIGTVRGFLLALRKENVIYISDWEFDSSNKPSIRVYSLVKNKRNFDVKPPKKSKAQISRECRARKAANTILSRTRSSPIETLHHGQRP